MSKLEPLDPELSSLFAREPIPAPDAEAAARVRHRIERSLATSGAVHDAANVPASPRIGSLRLAGTTFILGSALGLGAGLALRSEPPARVERLEVAPVSSTSEVAVLSPAATEAPKPTVSAAPPPTVAVPRREVVDTLGAERALVERARAALSSGDASVALAHLDEHARRFPNARLTEEREALAIQALVNVGRYEDARTRADAFGARWPASVYSPAVNVTIRSIP